MRPETDLKPDFVEKCKLAVESIIDHAKSKCIDGNLINGPGTVWPFNLFKYTIFFVSSCVKFDFNLSSSGALYYILTNIVTMHVYEGALNDFFNDLNVCIAKQNMIRYMFC